MLSSKVSDIKKGGKKYRYPVRKKRRKKKEQKVLTLNYFDKLTMNGIGQTLSVGVRNFTDAPPREGSLTLALGVDTNDETV